MSEIAKFETQDGIGILTIDSPPVNALGVAVRRGLDEGFARFAADTSARAIVLICGGRTFFAGADINEFGKPPQSPLLSDIFASMDATGKPIVAAMHGTALGGGLELALNCNYRVAAVSAKLGLPEVKLGLLPGAGGTQRLTRIVGVEAALDLITSGRQIGAEEALALGVIDALASASTLREEAIAFASGIANKPLVRVRDREEQITATRGKPEIFEAFRAKNTRSFRGFKAPENIIKSIEAAVSLPFDEGISRERELFLELQSSTESRAQRYIFFAERETAKIPDVPADTTPIPIASVGVIGAGTMGGGIAMNFLNAGIPVTLVEMNQEALDRGLAVIRRNYEATAKKGRMTTEQVDQRMALLTPTVSLSSLSTVDLAIEAVFEEMSVKTDIFGKLDAICKPGAILASNTSFLDLDEIAAATSRPDHVIGLHFFSPANVMRLLENVRGAKTSNEVIATSMKLAKVINKVPVLSRVCRGFIANRIMAARSIQADAIVLEGTTPTEIDRAIYDYGFAMGPFQTIDLVGIDVLTRGLTERTLRGDFAALGRFGQKTGGGFYDYDATRRPMPSATAAQVVAEFAAYKGVVPTGPQRDADILARLLYPVVNEGAKLLEEGIALRASDIDVAAILGYNWPVYTGGPMFWADTIGLPVIVAKLKALEALHGDAFTPCRLLETLAAEDGSFTGKR
jgi:3-hydroxyacyl-CoA dehydrogenase